MSIQEMKRAVATMPSDERAEFIAWLDDQYRGEGQYQGGGQHRRQEKDEAGEPEKKPVTFDDIKHLLGRGDGPGDLSTNPMYMDDFGQSSMQ